MNETTITFLIYILGMLFLGLCGYVATKNLSDYILGGRRIGSWVTALSTGASDMSGWLLMGLPGAVFLSGISEMWIAVGLIIGAWLNWKFIAVRLRLYTEKSGNALTLPDYLSNRFEDHTHILRIIAAVVILVFFTLYCSAGVVASARLFQNVFGLSYDTALWLGTFTTIVYVFLGGFFTISWTDTIQASLVFSALVVAPIMVIIANGGLIHSIDTLKMIKPTHIDIIKDLDLISIISLLAWGLGYFGQPHILVRFMATKNTQSMPKARRINITWMTLCLGGAVLVGFFGSVYFAENPNLATIVNTNSETVFIEIAKHLFNPWIAGILLAAILSAIMSNLSCQLLVCSSALTKDIYKTFLRKNASQSELLWIGRFMVLIIAFIAIWIASNPNSQILKMVSYAWAGFGAAFGPVILISLFWQRMTKEGAIAGMVIGALTVIIWKQYAWFSLYEIIPGFLFATLSIIVVSLLNQAPARQVMNLFKSVRKEIRATT